MRGTIRRVICRGSFLAFAVIPTSVAVGWSLLWNMTAIEHADEVSRLFGLTAELIDLRRPLPGVMSLASVQLADPETGELVASSRNLRLHRANRSILLEMERTMIEPGQLGKLCQLLENPVLRHRLNSNRTVVVMGDELLVRHTSGDCALSRLWGKLDASSIGPKVEWQFRPAGATTGEPIQIRMVRDRRTKPPTTRIEWDTGQWPLPCWLLGELVPFFRSLGDTATFQGRLWAQPAAAGWRGELAGRLTSIPLEGLVEAASSHVLQGQADVVLRDLKFEGNKIHLASGSISAGPGTVSASLLRAAATTLSMTTPEGTSGSETDLAPYQLVRAGFLIDSSGLALYGHCPGVPRGTIMSGADGVLLGQPIKQPQPVMNLIRMLVPESSLHVPATRQTEPLVRMLPLPELNK